MVAHVVHWAGSLQVRAWGDHPDGEVVVGDLQFHCTMKEPCDGRMEIQIGEELESRTKGAVVDEDADELLHDRFGILIQFGESSADLCQGGQRELRSDLLPDLLGDGAAVYVRWHAN